MVVKAPPPPPVPVYSWTGCYIGIEGGGDWGSSHHTAPAFGGVDIAAPFSLSGGLVGGTLGCNYQTKQWVFGVEGDGSWTNKSGSGPDPVAPFNAPCWKICTPVVQTFVREGQSAGTARRALGSEFWPVRAFIYATGGVAFGRVNVKATSMSLLHPAFGDPSATSRGGDVVGAGVEWASRS